MHRANDPLPPPSLIDLTGSLQGLPASSVLAKVSMYLQDLAALQAMSVGERVALEMERLGHSLDDVVNSIGPDLSPAFRRLVRGRAKDTISVQLLQALYGLDFDTHFLLHGRFQSGGIGLPMLRHAQGEMVRRFNFDEVQGFIFGAGLQFVLQACAAQQRVAGVMPFVRDLAPLSRSVLQLFCWDEELGAYGCGTATVVGNGCFALTCFHAVDGRSQHELRSSRFERPIEAQVVWTDPALDLALLEAEHVLADPVPIAWDEALIQGEAVATIGFPSLYSPPSAEYMAQPLVNGAHISQTVGELRLTASTNFGASGAPVLNANGEIVAVLSKTDAAYHDLLSKIEEGYQGDVQDHLIELGKLAALAREAGALGYALATPLSGGKSMKQLQQLLALSHAISG